MNKSWHNSNNNKKDTSESISDILLYNKNNCDYHLYIYT